MHKGQVRFFASLPFPFFFTKYGILFFGTYWECNLLVINVHKMCQYLFFNDECSISVQPKIVSFCEYRAITAELAN